MPQSAPKLSVIIPAYKVEKYVRECLDSVISQSFKDLELICVDDASPDATPAILDDYAAREPRIKVIHLPENRGLFGARRAGILASHGKYVMFLDSDDIFEVYACEKAYNLIENAQTDLVVFGTSLLRNGKLERGTNFLTPKFTRIEARNLLDSCFRQKLFVHTIWNKIYNGDLIRHAASLMPTAHISGIEDYLQFFIIGYFLKSAFAAPQELLIRYRFGIGRGGNFGNIVRTAETIPLAGQWLAARTDAQEEDKLALREMSRSIYQNILDGMLEVPKLSASMLLTIGKLCGGDILISFIEATGLLDMPIVHRRNICTRMVDTIRQHEETIARLKNL